MASLCFLLTGRPFILLYVGVSCELYCAKLCYAALCCAVLCCAAPCCAVLCCALLVFACKTTYAATIKRGAFLARLQSRLPGASHLSMRLNGVASCTKTGLQNRNYKAMLGQPCYVLQSASSRRSSAQALAQIVGTQHAAAEAVLCCAMLCCAVLCCAMLCCAVLCCAVLCCAVLCCAVAVAACKARGPSHW